MIASVLIHFCKFVLKSLLASALVCIISLSIMTKKFPPDLSQLKTTYNLVRNLQAMSLAKSNELAPTPGNYINKAATEDEDVQELLQQRQKVLVPLSDMAESMTEGKLGEAKSNSCENQELLVHQLKNKIAELDDQNLLLNKMLLELKYKKH